MRVFELRVAAGEPAERASAEAWEAGAAGIEERDLSDGRSLLVIYAPGRAVEAVRAAAGIPGAEVGESQPVEDRDWVEEWQQGLSAVEVGTRLVVRPSFVDPSSDPARVELVIDPGQAFGTGGHASTLLALEAIEAASAEPGAFEAESRVLDVGAGTGVLALAALALGAGRAVGFDLDPEAGAAARIAAAGNGFADRLDVFVGPIEALAGARFDWVFANLLKREMLPIAAEIAAATRTGGRAVFSGLLGTERGEVEQALRAVGFTPTGERTLHDANGDEWIALIMARS